MTFQWKHAQEFYDRVEQLHLHGLHFQHIELCRRRAWMYLHQINFAQWHERVHMGTAKHQTSYQRDRSTIGLFGLAPDRIDWQARIVHENKGTGGAAKAADMQSAFYALMLSIATRETWKAMVHVLSTREKRSVLLDESLLRSLWDASCQLEMLAKERKVPHAFKINLCASCSLSVFCNHG